MVQRVMSVDCQRADVISKTDNHINKEDVL